jgi:hypothetical protein
MDITITQEDWMKLTLPTRQELQKLILNKFQATAEQDDDPHLYEMNLQMIERFMEAVSEKTEVFIRCFAKDGIGRVDELLEATGYKEPGNFRGVLAGTTTRLRKLFSDPDAYMIAWREDPEVEDGEGHYYVKEGTRQALEAYFKE